MIASQSQPATIAAGLARTAVLGCLAIWLCCGGPAVRAEYIPTPDDVDYVSQTLTDWLETIDTRWDEHVGGSLVILFDRSGSMRGDADMAATFIVMELLKTDPAEGGLYDESGELALVPYGDTRYTPRLEADLGRTPGEYELIGWWNRPGVIPRLTRVEAGLALKNRIGGIWGGGETDFSGAYRVARRVAHDVLDRSEPGRPVVILQVSDSPSDFRRQPPQSASRGDGQEMDFRSYGDMVRVPGPCPDLWMEVGLAVKGRVVGVAPPKITDDGNDSLAMDAYPRVEELDFGRDQARKVLRISNQGQGELHWRLSSPEGASWLRHSPADWQTGDGDALIEVNRSTLPPGVHRASLELEWGDKGNPERTEKWVVPVAATGAARAPVSRSPRLLVTGLVLMLLLGPVAGGLLLRVPVTVCGTTMDLWFWRARKPLRVNNPIPLSGGTNDRPLCYLNVRMGRPLITAGQGVQLFDGRGQPVREIRMGRKMRLDVPGAADEASRFTVKVERGNIVQASMPALLIGGGLVLLGLILAMAGLAQMAS